MTERLNHFIGGAPVAPSSGEYFSSTNPATLDTLYEAARGNEEDVRRAVAAAREAFGSPGWARLSPTRRGRLLRNLGDLIAEHADELARYESLDNGKLLREMRGQMATLPEYYYYYGGLADKVQGAQIPTTAHEILNYTQHEPLGVVGAITPWNSPLTLTTSKLAPALAAGNTVVIKPSEYTSRTILRLAELASEAGFPDGVVNVVTGFGAEAGAALVSHPDLAKISFTGSTQTGSRIAAEAASRFIGCTLELGGKSPNIIFEDANVANAAMGVIAGIYAAAGQTCIAGSRVFAHKAVYDELLERVTQRARTIRIGDPLVDSTELGPLAFADQLAKVESYVNLGLAEGASVRAGGVRPEVDLPGYFYAPTVLTDVDNSMRVVREEIFGPVCTVLDFESEAEAIRMANDSNYGLAAGLWTQNLSRAHRVAARLQAGQVYVNEYPSGGVETPFGGYKQSGIGREKGREALNHYTQLKTVIVTL